MVKDILTNPIYVKSSNLTHQYFELNDINVTGEPNGCGYLTYGKHKMERKRINLIDICYFKHEGVIDDLTWLDIQKVVDKQSKRGCRTGSGKNGILSGVLKCAKCGSAMVLTYSSRGKDKENRSYYYKCNKKYTMYKCNNANVNGAEIENFVIDKIKVCDKDVLVNEYKKLKMDFSNLKKIMVC